MKQNYLLSKHPQIFQPARTCDACTILTQLKIYPVGQILSSMGRIAERAFASPGSWSSGCGPITIPEHNQEAVLYLQELASTLPIQKFVQVHLQGNTSRDSRIFCAFSQSITSL